MTSEEWEQAFTAAVVATVSRMRIDAGLTIEQFARECDRVVGDSGRFKPNTMQALFAGKRKSVTTSELVVFAGALDVPLLSLLIPDGSQRLPAPGGSQLAPLDVWTLAVGTGQSSPSEHGAYARHELDVLGELARTVTELRSSLSAYYYLDQQNEGTIKVGTPRVALVEEIRGALRDCKVALSSQPDLAGHEDPVIEWARHANPSRLTDETLTAIARVFHEAAPSSATRPAVRAANPDLDYVDFDSFSSDDLRPGTYN